jgi:hypothetical protein
VLSQDNALRAISALYGYSVTLADVVALGFLAHCNYKGVKCGFMLVYYELKRAGRTRNKTQAHDMVKNWLNLGLVERGRNRGRFANLALRLTPDGHLLLHRFEALLQKAAEKGFYPDDPGSQA